MSNATPEQLFQRARANLAAGRLVEAEDDFRLLTSMLPNSADAFNELGIVLQRSRKLNESLQAFDRAIALSPADPHAHSNRSRTLWLLQWHVDAAAAAQKAIELAPKHAVAHNNLAEALRMMGRPDEALAEYETALQLSPAHEAVIRNNLAQLRLSQGRAQEAVADYRASLAANPSQGLVYDNYLQALHYVAGISAAERRAEHERWAERFADPLTPAHPQFINDRDPSRRLRVGYVSPNFFNHPIGFFLLPILENHDPGQVEVICYNDSLTTDASSPLPQLSHQWHDVAGLDDAALAERIRNDRIDVLVDLALHTTRHRLLCFARKPAPVQVTYLTYASTSGMRAMDWRITDDVIDPPGQTDAFYTERSYRLPGCYWCYRPPSGIAGISLRSAEERLGQITFGCLNLFAKINQAVLSTWSEILGRVTPSRLVLHSDLGRHREVVRKFFAERNIDPRRIEFLARRSLRDYFQSYNDIDIVLDPFPYNGGTTTCDALWMGCPVITLAGDAGVSRAGASILTAIGLDELIARHPTGYVHLAVTLARDCQRRERVRRTLRDRMRASPLMNEKAFTAGLEQAYRQMWHAWVTSQPSR